PTRTRLRTPLGGAQARTQSCTDAVWLTPPSVTWPQSLAQVLLETAGPFGFLRWPLPWQHLSLPRQQARSEDKALRAWARGARGESEKNTARQTATRPRAERKLDIALNIPWSRSITRRQSSGSAQIRA